MLMKKSFQSFDVTEYHAVFFVSLKTAYLYSTINFDLTFCSFTAVCYCEALAVECSQLSHGGISYPFTGKNQV